jgi:glycosyltransferase involved in cell wall biosynthesis
VFAEFYPPQGLLEWVLLCSIALYALGIVWFLSGTRHRRACCAVQPFASIVIAARDEEQRIRSCLLSLLAQDYPSERFEVIVVDDGSRDDTAHIVEKLCVQDARLRLLRRSPGGSKKAALAQAIEQARGEIILTTDADCQVGAQWLRGMLAHFDANVGVVIGFSQIGAPGQVMSWRGAYEAVDFLQLMTCIWGSTGRGHAMAAS